MMDFDGPGWGFGPGLHALWLIPQVLFGLLLFAVAVALVFLLIRFLLVATRAAQLYVQTHEPARPAAPTTPAAPAAAPASDPTPPDVPRTARTRTPKPPAA